MRSIQAEIRSQKWEELLEKMRVANVSRKVAEAQQHVRNCRCDLNCEICGGEGYYRVNPEAGIHDKGFGKVEPCPNYRRAQLKLMDVSQFGMESDELDLDWGVVRNKIGHLRLDATSAVKAVKPRYESGHGMIALLGPYGQGKTLVGKILIAKALNAGKRAAYANMAHILDDIRTAFDEKEHMMKELLQRMEYWIGLDVLFVDELDKVNGTEWAAERIFQLMDQRYARAIREEALTVIASNKADDELDGYLVSRLKDTRFGPGAVVYLNGDDARGAMPKGWRH